MRGTEVIGASGSGPRRLAPDDLDAPEAIPGRGPAGALFERLEGHVPGEERRDLIARIKPGYGTGCLSKSGFDVEMNIAVTYQLVKQAITFQDFANTTYAGECP